MNADERALMERLVAAEAKIRELSAYQEERKQTERRSTYLNPTDAQRAAGTREQDRINASRTGQRFYGGFDAGARTVAQNRTGIIEPTTFDTVSASDEESTRGTTGGGGGGGSTLDPFFPIPSATDPEVTFEPGIIMNGGRSISPTVDGGSTMATMPRPVLTITVSGTIYLDATVDAAGVATSIDTLNAATTPTDTSTHKYLTLADVTLTTGIVTVTSRPIRESRPLFVCNDTAIWD